jgi:undecaprenyl-diphosphatase
MTMVTRYFLKWDTLLFSCVVSRARRAQFNRLVWWISRSADGHAYPALVALFALLEPRRWKEILAASLFAFALELPVYKLIKQWVRRVRPFESIEGVERLIIAPDLFSFPSGHVAAAFVVATLLGHFYPPVLPLFYFWASLVGFSRIYLGVHYPTDVAAGAFLGSVSAKAGLLLSAFLL